MKRVCFLLLALVLLAASVTNAQSQTVVPRLSEPGVIFDYSVIDAAYSKSLQRIVAVSANPNLLHFLDPAAMQDETMPLPQVPLNFSLSADGRFAAVNHGFLVSYIDLTARSIVKTFEPEVYPTFVILDQGRIHLVPTPYTYRAFRSINISTGFESVGRTQYYSGIIKRQLSGYSYGTNGGITPQSIQKYSAATGVLEAVNGGGGDPNNILSICDNLWFSEDGSRIFTACGRVVSASADPQLDFAFAGQLQGQYFSLPYFGYPTYLIGLTHSSASKRIAAFSGIPSDKDLRGVNDWVPDSDLLVFDDATYELLHRRRLPGFVLGSQLYPAHGQFAFFTADGSQIAVLMKADAKAALPPHTALVKFPVTLTNPGISKVALSDLGSTVTVTAAASSIPIVGHATMKAEQGGNTPAGVAIYSYRPNDVTLSETGVALVAPIRSGRLLVEAGGPVRTGLALSNPADVPVLVKFYTTKDAVNSLESSFSIPAHGQIAAFLDEVPFAANGAVIAADTFTFHASVPIGATALRCLLNEQGEILINTLPIANLDESVVGPLSLPQIATGGGWYTDIVLINPSDNVLTGVFDFHNRGPAPIVDGQVTTSVAYSIPPRGVRRVTVGATVSNTVVGWVQITPDPGQSAPVGTGILSFKRSNITVTMAGVPAVTAGKAFRLPFTTNADFVFGNRGGVGTGIAIVNHSSVETVVTLETTFPNGLVPMNKSSLKIAAFGQTSLFLNQAGVLTSFPPGGLNGMLRISTAAGTDISVTGLRGLNNERGDFVMTTLPVVNEASPSPPLLLIPHIVSGGGYTTRLMLLNGSAGNVALGELRTLQQSGEALDLGLK